MDFSKMDFRGYLRKEYIVKFWKFFTLKVISEDREDGTYKHFITVYFCKKSLVHICYRTGMSINGYEVSPLDKNISMGVIVKGDNKHYYFKEGKTCAIESISSADNDMFESKFKDAKMTIFSESPSRTSRKIRNHYFE